MKSEIIDKLKEIDYQAVIVRITSWIWRFKFSKALGLLTVVILTCAGGGVLLNIHATHDPESRYVDYTFTPGDATKWGCILAFIFVIGYVFTLYVYDRQENRKLLREQTAKENDDVNLFKQIYIPIFNHIFQELDVDAYRYWTYSIAVAGETTIQIDRYEKLRLLSNYCDNRQHVEGYEHWDSLIANFGQLLKDILNLFDAHSRLEGETQYRFQHFYNDIRPYNHEKAEEALNEYKAEIWLIADLTFELTRLCNLILDNIREIVPDFCIEAGVLKIEEAKDKNNCDTIIEYEKTQKSDSPYPGLEAFLIERSNRRHVYDVSSDSNWLRQVLIKDFVLR